MSSPSLSLLSPLIPPLSPSAYKGQAGRIGVVGGSADYTGAPFFAAYSAMRCGADLGFVVCTPGAAGTIKGYAPDLIVTPALREDDSEEALRKTLHPLFQRFHSVVIGPGLGRDEGMLRAGRAAITVAKELELPIVLDADGLYLLSLSPSLLQGYPRALLTPNVVEFGRLCKALEIEVGGEDEDAAVMHLAKTMGCTVLQKGGTDRVSNGRDVLRITAPGSLKRSGGQGDVLSGCAGVFLAWSTLAERRGEVPEEKRGMLAAYAAAHVARESARRAYEKRGRGMVARDLLEEVGGAWAHYFEEKEEKKGAAL